LAALGWLAACYFASTEFRRLDPKSQTTRRGVIEDCLRESRKPGSTDPMRDCPVNMLSAAHVKMLRDRKAATPERARWRAFDGGAVWVVPVVEGLQGVSVGLSEALCAWLLPDPDLAAVAADVVPHHTMTIAVSDEVGEIDSHGHASMSSHLERGEACSSSGASGLVSSS
jgi:hypothetical protein